MQTSQLFEECKKQFLFNIDKLQSLCKNNQIDQKDLEIFSKLVNETKLHIKHISVELCSLSSKKAKSINQVTFTLKKQLKPYKEKFRFFEKKLQIINNEALVSQQTAQNTNMTVKQLQENDKLIESKKLLYQMEDISSEVSQNLKSQTEKMQKSKATLFDTNLYLSKANSLIDKMIARQRRKQMVTCMTLTAAILIIGGLKYCCY